MPRGFVCGCGALSRARVCERCSAERAAARAAYDAVRNAASFYRTPFWQRLSAACKRRDGGRCVACGSDDRVVAHHIEPRDNSSGSPAPGLLDRLGNLVTLCAGCHSTLEADRRAGRDDTPLIRLTRLLAY